MILEREAEEVAEDKPVLGVGVDAECGVDDPGWCVLQHCVWECIVEAGPVSEGMCPDVGAQEVLSVDGGGDVGEDGLDIAFYCILPLLVRCGALVAALVVLVKCVCLGGSERRVVVAAEDAGFESAAGEETEDSFQVVEERVFVAGLDWVAEEIFAASVPECDELAVSFDAFGADWADVVIADAFPDVPS